MGKLVSVCMPVYNSEKYLEGALDSIARQSYKNIEVIIVNDGSTDQTETLANKLLEDLQLTGQVLTIENRGPEAARDYGLKHANGVYLAPLDSDDLWEPDYLTTMVSALEKHPNIGLAFSDFVIFDETSGSEIQKSQTVGNIELIEHNTIDNNTLIFESKHFLSYALSGQVIFPSCSVYRNSFYKKIGPYTKSLHLYISCDWEFGLRATINSDIIYIKTPYLRKRKHENNISGSGDKTAEADTKVLKLILDTYDLDSHARAIAINRLAVRSFDVGYFNFERNNYSVARHWFLESLRHKFSNKTLLYLSTVMLPKFLTLALVGLKRRL